ncbi:MAG: T9SS type A sorting domain-containing protein [Bacteroidales bacterium]|nr:T9SS type A sorting domain-containing protein [Bacteroidales bacterium]
MKRFILIFVLFIPVLLNAQLSDGGYPLSMLKQNVSENYRLITLAAPDVEQLLQQDNTPREDPGPYRVGAPLSTDIDLVRDGSAESLSSGALIIRLGIQSRNARGLILYYERFRIPEGGMLYIYSKNKSQLIGAFTHKNNPAGGYFATEMISGDELVLEYNAGSSNARMPVIHIYEVHYIYRDIGNDLKGSSGPCEVNVNCPEGNSWQNEKKSVAKIFLKDGSGSYLCTGALVNNTRQDSTPYFLTARHCGSDATANHFSQWIFYFNYESPTCEDPVNDPPSGTLIGCELVSQAPDGTSSGSDFKLLKLGQRVPEGFNPWFAGWNLTGQVSMSGVGIHHPQGDIKKISTYKEPLLSVDYSSSSPNTNGDYWRVIWAETANGYGVTEGGSSGSPLFDNSGKIIGTLTGGAASCANPDAPDYYGKFASHWESNGSVVTAQLRPWLDPGQTGVLSMEGFGYGNLLTAGFSADTSVISVGGSVQFTDLSTGDPDQWDWTFYGGTPSTYSGRQPGRITYQFYGEYHVSLVVKDNNLSDSLLKEKYIRVTPNIYPVPAREYVVIDFGNRSLALLEVSIFDVYGRLVGRYKTSDIADGIWQIQLDDIRTGNYIMHIKTDVKEDYLKLIVY